MYWQYITITSPPKKKKSASAKIFFSYHHVYFHQYHTHYVQINIPEHEIDYHTRFLSYHFCYHPTFVLPGEGGERETGKVMSIG